MVIWGKSALAGREGEELTERKGPSLLGQGGEVAVTRLVGVLVGVTTRK
jgi:hypothetical protein